MSGTPDERSTDHPETSTLPIHAPVEPPVVPGVPARRAAVSPGTGGRPAARPSTGAPDDGVDEGYGDPTNSDDLDSDVDTDYSWGDGPDYDVDGFDQDSGDDGPGAAAGGAAQEWDEPDEDGVRLGERVTVRLPRRRPGPPPRSRRRAPVLVAATATTLVGALLIWLPVVLLVVLGTRLGGGGGPGVGGTLRASLAVWLLAHGVPVYLGATKVSLAPLALTILAGWRLTRAGVHTARAIGSRRRRPGRPAILAALSVALVYALLGLLAGHLADGAGVTVDPVGAALRTGVFALVLGGLGAAVESGLARRLRERSPAVLRDGLRAGLVAALLVLGAGAGVAGVALAVHAGDASDVLGSYHAGLAGQAGLTLICVAYAPNLAVWSAAYLIGPGFAFGIGTSVSPAHVTLDALPAVPVLVGLPTTSVSGFGVLLLGLPVAGGMVAGGLLVRRRLRETEGAAPNWRWLLGTALLAGPVAGVLLGIAALASGGSLGAARLAEIGPVAWQVAAVGAGVVALGTLLGGAATAVALTPARPRRPAPRPRRPRRT